MDKPNQSDKNKFLSPHSRYYGQVKPDNLVFNANLQEFTQKVGYITCLQTNGKLAPEDAYNQIKALWKHNHSQTYRPNNGLYIQYKVALK
ncbi:MAG: hypothetical protein V7L31_13360 [Nostoc sp.]|uniref:DUF7219 family protein n=1 Tax=Nostoc sp. TaxID=1180 RepID=UPI002FF1CC27